MHIVCINPSDAAVANSTNQDWGLLGLRCLLVFYNDAPCNVGY